MNKRKKNHHYFRQKLTCCGKNYYTSDDVNICVLIILYDVKQNNGCCWPGGRTKVFLYEAEGSAFVMHKDTAALFKSFTWKWCSSVCVPQICTEKPQLVPCVSQPFGAWSVNAVIVLSRSFSCKVCSLWLKKMFRDALGPSHAVS